MKKNQDQRSKYPNDPSKYVHDNFVITMFTEKQPRRFIDSEADLDSAIKALLPLAQAPKLAYPELVRSGTAAAFVDLLSHENVDIVIDVVEVVHELTDEDVMNEDDDEDENETVLKALIEELVSNILPLN